VSLWSTKEDRLHLWHSKQKTKKKNFEQLECHSHCYIRLQENQAALNGIATKCVEYGEKVKKFFVTCRVYLILSFGLKFILLQVQIKFGSPQCR